MPIYTWIDVRSKKQLDVNRDFEKYEESPTEEEMKEAKLDPKVERKWERIIVTTPIVRKLGSWAGKGNW